jgi:hypothetical protein
MKDSNSAAKKLLDLPYAPEAEALLDELERTGQFRVGIEAEIEDAAESGNSVPSNEYHWGRGSGSVSIQDWWTTGRVTIQVAPGLGPEDIVLARSNGSLLIRTIDGLDRALIESYLDLIPDASTLRIIFADGTEWSGTEVFERVTSWVVELESAQESSNH